MRCTIDSAGRVVIPRALRERAALAPGTPLALRYEDGSIVLEPAPSPVRIARRGRFTVAEPATPRPPLGAEVVEETRARVRRDRGGSEGKG